MFDILNYSLKQAFFFLLVLLRITGFVFSAPFLGDRNVPVQIRFMLALVFSVAVFPSLRLVGGVPTTVAGLIFWGGSELLVGMAMGFLASLVFFAVQLAGQIAGYQMGLAIANVFDPVSANRQSVVSSILFWTAMVVFFLSDMHLLLLKGLRDSFVYLPMAFGSFLSPEKVADLSRLVANLFLVSAQLGAPIMFTLLFVMISLGLITRLIPQMNIFIVGIPVQILVGILVLFAMTPLFAGVSRVLLSNHFGLWFRFVTG